MYDNMADLYSIIRTTEALEKAYVRDFISAEEYVNECAPSRALAYFFLQV